MAISINGSELILIKHIQDNPNTRIGYDEAYAAAKVINKGVEALIYTNHPWLDRKARGWSAIKSLYLYYRSESMKRREALAVAIVTFNAMVEQPAIIEFAKK